MNKYLFEFADCGHETVENELEHENLSVGDTVSDLYCAECGTTKNAEVVSEL